MSRLALFLSLAVLKTLSSGVLAEDLSCPVEPPGCNDNPSTPLPLYVAFSPNTAGTNPLHEFQLKLEPSRETPVIEPEPPAPPTSFFNEINPVSCGAPREKTDAEKHAAWIAELNSDDSEVRTVAFEALNEAGEAAIPAVKDAFLKPVSLEQAQRLSTLLVRGDGFGPEVSGYALRLATKQKHLKVGDYLEMTLTVANRSEKNSGLHLWLMSTDKHILGDVEGVPVSEYELTQNDTNDVQQTSMPQGNSRNQHIPDFGFANVAAKSKEIQMLQVPITEQLLSRLKATRSTSGEYAVMVQASPPALYYYSSSQEAHEANLKVNSLPIQFLIE